MRKSACSDVSVPSTWRPPRLETVMPSTPWSTASRSTVTDWIPVNQDREDF